MATKLETKAPVLFSLSLPKCGTSSLEHYFSTYSCWHENFSPSFIKAVKHYDKYGDREIVRNYLTRRYGNQVVQVDVSGYLHAVTDDIYSIFPESFILYVVRSPSSWVASYIQMLSEKESFFPNGKPSHSNAYLFDYFYIRRISSLWTVPQVINECKEDRPRLSTLILTLFDYWIKYHKRIPSFMSQENVIVCSLDELTEKLPIIEKKVGLISLHKSYAERILIQNASEKSELRDKIEDLVKIQAREVGNASYKLYSYIMQKSRQNK